MAQIAVEGLSKLFRDTAAVDNVSLTFADGALSVLVGPSGCGKTTLLRMVAGLEEPSRGAILVGSERVNELPAWERNMAMVFQSYALYPHMTVFANMAFPLQARKLPRAEIRQLVEQAARTLDIAHLLERKPRALSGGQMQRVALGRAIVRRPQAFLMDEPLSNLDALLRVETRAELKRLQRDLGITMLYVTHDQEEAMTLADSLIVMRAGCPEQVGTPEEVYHTPRTLFVARFMGSPPMNVLSCRYDAATHTLHTPTFARAAPPHLRPALAQAGPAIALGIRPESLTLHAAPTPEALAAEVYMVEPLGKETLITLALGAQRIKALAEPTLRPALNSPLWCSFADADMRLFDEATGLALPTG